MKIELNCLKKKLSSNVDPVIPIIPELDVYFDLNDCLVREYDYTFTEENVVIKTNKRVKSNDLIKFDNFFNLNVFMQG